MPRPAELNTDIVTWARLLSRSAPGIGTSAETSSPMSISTQDAKAVDDRKMKPTSSGHGSDESPPLSPLTSQSGGSTPKSPITPPSFDDRRVSKEETHSMNGELPPPPVLSDADLMRAPADQIIPPPVEFLERVGGEAKRREPFPAANASGVTNLDDIELRIQSPLSGHTAVGRAGDRPEVHSSDLFPPGSDLLDSVLDGIRRLSPSPDHLPPPLPLRTLPPTQQRQVRPKSVQLHLVPTCHCVY